MEDKGQGRSMTCGKCSVVFSDLVDFVKHRRGNDCRKPEDCSSDSANESEASDEDDLHSQSNRSGISLEKEQKRTDAGEMSDSDEEWTPSNPSGEDEDDELWAPSDPSSISKKKRQKRTAGKKPFPCKECGKAFDFQAQLRRHFLLHTGERPFKCASCDYEATETHNLTRHRRLVHKNENPFQCELCLTTFGSLQGQKQHEKNECIHRSARRKSGKKQQKKVRNERPQIPVESQRPPLRVERLFECEECSSSFSARSLLEKHALFHTGDVPKKFPCDQCEKAFDWLCQLERHLRCHTGEKPFACKSCEYAGTEIGSLTKHRRRQHRDEYPYQCCICNSTFQEDIQLTKHIKYECSSLPHQCKECSAKFDTEDKLVTHEKNCRGLHNKNGEGRIPWEAQPRGQFQCEECGVYLSSEGLIQKHMLYHRGETSKRYSCDQCDKTFDYLVRLERHLRCHTGEKPFACVSCDYAATEMTNLTKHRRLRHENEDPYQCYMCNSTFPDRSQVKHHMDYECKSTGAKCKKCSAKFATKDQLITHQEYCWRKYKKKHENRRIPDDNETREQFQCIECEVYLSSESLVHQHMLFHTGEISMKFPCDQCDKACDTVPLLERHMRFHRDDKSFFCASCNYAATQNCQIVRHRRSVHNNGGAYQCHRCYSTFKDNLQLRYHENNECHVPKSKPITCRLCHKRFATRDELRSHKFLSHNWSKRWTRAREQHVCAECGKVFGRRDSLKGHMLYHTGGVKKHACEQCDMSFNFKGQLVAHRLTHTGERPFKCSICNYGASEINNLKRHLFLVHSGKYQYQCEKCAKCFRTEPLLVHHVKYICHGEKSTSEEKSDVHQCEKCGKFLSSAAVLERHLQLHNALVALPKKCKRDEPDKLFSTDRKLKRRRREHPHGNRLVTTSELPFKCSSCSYTGDDMHSFTVHLQKHSRPKKGKPYTCEICNKSFLWESLLKRHSKVHTGEKPYRCSLCEFRSSVMSRLTTHRRSCHSGEKPYQCERCFETFDDVKESMAHAFNRAEKCTYVELGDQNNLVENMEIHESEPETYSCKECGRNFLSRLRLKKHLLLHPGKPYYCVHCFMLFKEIHELDEHSKETCSKRKANAERGKGERCRYPECFKSFTSRALLRSHIVMEHSSKAEKPFKCTHCDYTADVKDNLTQHALQHKAKKPHQCELCSKSFPAEWRLKRHIKQAHSRQRKRKKRKSSGTGTSISGQLNECKHCKLLFDTSWELNVHKVQDHSDTLKQDENTKAVTSLQQQENIRSTTSLDHDVHNNDDTLAYDEGIFGNLAHPFDENVIVNIGDEMVQLKPLNYVVYENDIPYEVTSTEVTATSTTPAEVIAAAKIPTEVIAAPTILTEVTATPTIPGEVQNPPHQEIKIGNTQEEKQIDVETVVDETAEDETVKEEDNLLTQQNVVICDELRLQEDEAAAAENVQFSHGLDLHEKQTHNVDVYNSVMQCLSMDHPLQTFLDNSLQAFLNNSSVDITNKVEINDQQLECKPQELSAEINEEIVENRQENLNVIENTGLGDGDEVLGVLDVEVRETSNYYDVVHVELPDDGLDQCSSVHNDEVLKESAPVNNEVVELQDKSVVPLSSAMLKNEDYAVGVPGNAVTHGDGVPDNPVTHGDGVPDNPVTHGDGVPDNPVTHGDGVPDYPVTHCDGVPDNPVTHSDEMLVMEEHEDAPIVNVDNNDVNDDDHILAEDGSTKGNDGSPQIEKEKCNKSSKAFMEDILGSARDKGNTKVKDRARKSEVTTADRSTRPFRCGLCDSSFTTKQTLMKHVLRHSGQNKPYRCDICDSRFVSKRSLSDHMSTHNREKPYHCDMCGKRFSQRSAVVSHRKSHNKNRKYLCGVCNKGFTVKSYLMVHLRTHSNDTPYKCSKCDKRFKTQIDLHSHTAKFHSEGRPHQCDQCGKLFTRLGFLNLHKERRSGGRGCYLGYKSVKCKVCRKSLFSRSALKSHMLIHNDEKPLQCAKCGKKFRCKSTLNVHMLTHGAKTLFPCADCGKVFKRKLWLRLHCQRSHSKAKKPRKCGYCDKVFADITQLGHHLKTHEKPKHTSDQVFKSCNSTTNSVCTVKTRGKQLHKPFNSTWCFAYKRRTEVQYECAFCGSLFGDKPSLLEHFEAFHGDDVIMDSVSSNLRTVNGQTVQLDLTGNKPQEFTVITGPPRLPGSVAPVSLTGATLPDKTVATTIKETTRPGVSTKTTGSLLPPGKPSGTSSQTVTPQNRHIRPLLAAGSTGPPVAVVRTKGFQTVPGKTGPIVLNQTGHRAPVTPVGPGTGPLPLIGKPGPVILNGTGHRTLVRPVGPGTINRTAPLIGKPGPLALTKTIGPSVLNKTPAGTTLTRPVGSGSAVRTTESPGPTGITTNLQGDVMTPTANSTTGVLQRHGLQV